MTALAEKERELRELEPEAHCTLHRTFPEHWSVHVWGREIAQAPEREVAVDRALAKLRGES